MLLRRAQALTLYREILKLHKKYLPQDLRDIGDAYVKSEFRLHKSSMNEDHIGQFFEQWEHYATSIRSTAQLRDAVVVGSVDSRLRGTKQSVNVPGFGSDLSLESELSEEQKVQLQKLKEEATKSSRK